MRISPLKNLKNTSFIRTPSPQNTDRKKANAISGNQKLNFTKNLEDLTPRSKALFFSLCKSPKKKANKEVISPVKLPNSMPLTPTMMMNMPSVMLTQQQETTNNNESFGSSTNLIHQESKKNVIVKLSVKEISEIIKADLINNSNNIIDANNTTNTNNNTHYNSNANKNYMKDLDKYSLLLQKKIIPSSPRTRQALINLNIDPNNFTHFTFEQLYNQNIGRNANIRRFMEYLSTNANQFLNVINERTRLIRLERDLNKKFFVNENVFSKNFSDSIFHLSTANRPTEQETEKLYYNFYFSEESRKRLNVSQKEFDSKLISNRAKYLCYKDKVDFLYKSLEQQNSKKNSYYKDWESNIKRIEENKAKMLKEKKNKALQYIEKAKNKLSEFKKLEKQKDRELEMKAKEIAEANIKELEEKTRNSYEKNRLLGEKDKQKEQELLAVEVLKQKENQLEFHKLEHYLLAIDEKNSLTNERRKEKLEEIKRKIRSEQKKLVEKVQRVKTLQAEDIEANSVKVLEKYAKNYEKTMKKKEQEAKMRSLSAKKKQEEAFKNFDFNKSKLKLLSKEKTREIMSKLQEDDMKSEKSAELRKKKVETLMNKNTYSEAVTRKNFEKEKKKMEKSKQKVEEFHLEIEQRKMLKSKQSVIIVDDARIKNIEASAYIEGLWSKSP